MIINADNLKTLRQGLQNRFEAGLRSKPPIDLETFVTIVPSGTEIENYPMGAFLTTMRKWVGPRQIGNFQVGDLMVVNDDYEDSIQVPCNKVQDDKIGIFGSVAEGKGRQAMALWPRLATLALIANGKWLDGSAFFLTNRKFNKATICNKTTAVLSPDSFDAAYLTMSSYLGYDGEPLEIVPDMLRVGPSNRKMAFSILESQNVVTQGGTGDVYQQTDNSNRGLCQFQVDPRLVGDHADKWYLMCTNQPLKPVLVQKRKEGPLVALDKPTDLNVFAGTIDGENAVPGGVYLYGVHYRGAAALALPHLCYGGGQD